MTLRMAQSLLLTFAWPALGVNISEFKKRGAKILQHTAGIYT